jgi:hypothetical protein
MKKIGILTYTREYANLGTNMQCYCTLKAVQRAFPDARVEVVDYSVAAPVRRPYLSGVSAHSLVNDLKRIRKYTTFFKTDLTFSPRRLTSRNVSAALDFIKSQHYDAIFVGADTVLELKNSSDDQLTAYWLDASIKGTKCLLAASCHNVTFEALSENQRACLQSTIDDFALLGVRDHATFRLLSYFTRPGDQRLQLVADPTFTYDIDYAFVEKYLAKRRLRVDKPVVCLHLTRGAAWAPALADRFRKAGYIVASLRPANYVDLLFNDLSPFEQMGIYRYFSLVITHRFHDAVFCLKNMTPVIAFPEHVADITAYGESKVQTLFDTFGLQGVHYIAKRRALTAEHLFDVHGEAIAQFAENEQHIRSVLREHKSNYYAFLQRSRDLVT